MLEFVAMIAKAGHEEFFDGYALLPNCEGVLKKKVELYNALPITDDLYELVKVLDSKICDQMVDKQYANIVKVSSCNRQNLRDELLAVVKQHEDKCWKNRKLILVKSSREV